MSKYAPLWEYVCSAGEAQLTLSFSQIQSVLGFPIDHSFLTYKKELTRFGYAVKSISMKKETIVFIKTE